MMMEKLIKLFCLLLSIWNIAAKIMFTKMRGRFSADCISSGTCKFSLVKN